MTCRGWSVYVVDRKLPTTCQLSNCQHICWPQAAWNCHTRVTGKFSPQTHPTTHDFLSPWCEQGTICSWHCTDTLWPRHMLNPLPTSGPNKSKTKHTPWSLPAFLYHISHTHTSAFYTPRPLSEPVMEKFQSDTACDRRLLRLLFHRSDQLQLIKHGHWETKWKFNRDAMVAPPKKLRGQFKILGTRKTTWSQAPCWRPTNIWPNT